ncbi:MAG: tetratricopeptide repeat protein [Pseudomonadota bacterium]
MFTRSKKILYSSCMSFAVLVLFGCETTQSEWYEEGNKNTSGRSMPVERHREVRTLPDVTPTPIPRTEAKQEQQQLAVYQRQSQSPVVADLLSQAQAHVSAGKHLEAAAVLERALRIAPQSADVYHRLAEVRLFQGNYAESEQLARRALSLLDTQSNLHQSLWLLIAESRNQRGDRTGAEEAFSQSQR